MAFIWFLFWLTNLIHQIEAQYPNVLQQQPVVRISQPVLDCDANYIDIVLVVDNSKSIEKHNFQLVKNFLQSFVDHFRVEVDSGFARIGMIEYASDVRVAFLLNDFMRNTKGVNEKVEQLSYKGGESTAIGEALEATLLDTLSQANGGNLQTQVSGTNYHTFVILFTDGQNTIGIEPDEPADTLKNAGAKIIGVGVGGFNETQLSSLSSPGYVFNVSTFSGLSSEFADKISKSICKRSCEVQAGCHRDATCENTQYNIICTCLPGYEGDGYVCKDVDECSDPIRYQVTCQSPSVCKNIPGSYMCICPKGYKMNEQGLCELVDLCIGVTCPEKAGCNRKDGQCYCVTGFRLVENECVDENECNDRDRNCPEVFASCFNNYGGFQCKCKEGFVGTYPFCQDLDECVKHRCARNADCRNNYGSYDCVCRPGFFGNGKRRRGCKPVPTTTTTTTTTPAPVCQCVNGGVCGRDGCCTCPEGFSGCNCENFVAKMHYEGNYRYPSFLIHAWIEVTAQNQQRRKKK